MSHNNIKISLITLFLCVVVGCHNYSRNEPAYSNYNNRAGESARPYLLSDHQKSKIRHHWQERNQSPVSTFSIDVDTASYTYIQQCITDGKLPSSHQIRIEEMINYFDYNYSEPRGEVPVAVEMNLTDCPWNDKRNLVHIGLKARDIKEERKPANLVFLIDVSGSMSSREKLPLLKEGMLAMVDELNRGDQVAIVTYAGGAEVKLQSTTCNYFGKKRIRKAIEDLSSGGSTNGEAGIHLAYEIADQNFQEDAINRVILASDGDFNVGATSDNKMVRLVRRKAQEGVNLTVLGFGHGSFNDSMMEQISNNGNGNYFYISNRKSAEEILCKKLTSTLQNVAEDVKLQVEFNPKNIEYYRLVGYSNRLMKNSEFDKDQKDAGDMGAGHTVTALYEVQLRHPVRKLKYESAPTASEGLSKELLTLSMRYKQPGEDVSQLLKHTLDGDSLANDKDVHFASIVAAFGQILKGWGDIKQTEELIETVESYELDNDKKKRDFVELMCQYVDILKER